MIGPGAVIDDPGVGLWPEEDPHGFPENDDLEAMDAKDQVDYLVEWFGWNFEDPAQETPRDDGEFLYIWGGPYDATDEINNRFAGIASEEAIELAVAELEQHGWEWAPSGRRVRPMPPEEPPSTASLDDLMEEAFDRLNAVEEAIESIPPQAATIGHNNPPSAIDDYPYSPQVESELRSLVQELKDELTADTPIRSEIEERAERARTFGQQFVDWARRMGGLASDEAAKQFGRRIGDAAAVVVIGAIAALGVALLESAVAIGKVVIALF